MLLDPNPPEFPASWAVAWGKDLYGLWQAFEIGGVRQVMRWIPPGEYMMGSSKDYPLRYDDEVPRHPVVIGPGFWLFDTPVTQALWQAVMGENDSRFKDPQRPVEQVSWGDCRTFLERLNGAMPELALALPSEAEWEYACRAGSESAIYSGELEIVGDGNAPALNDIAWYGGNSGVGFNLDYGEEITHLKDRQFPDNPGGTHPVGQKLPNDWGLYDMLGNVWEWTADSWHGNYQGAPADGSIWDGGAARPLRVVRGGSWHNRASHCRCAYRGLFEPNRRLDVLGFRPVSHSEEHDFK